MHTEQDISKIIDEIIKIKKVSSPKIKSKLKAILTKYNRIIKYKKELSTLYGEKINKNNINHMNMLYDIYSHFNKNDRNIKEIDQKWRKIKIFII